MEKKYELTDDVIEVFERTLHRIKALKDFANVKCGDLGGYIESENNLSHYDNARVYDNAKVCNNAWVYNNAGVCDNALIESGDDYATISNFGSEDRTTTFFRQEDNSIGVKCGCFYGTIDEFRNKVKETHGDSYYAEEYLMIADLMEMRFKNREKDRE